MAGEICEDQGLDYRSSISTPIHPRDLLGTCYELLENAGLSRIRFHELRHKSAGLMLSNGVLEIIMSWRLGPARISIMEDVFGHRIPGTQAEAVRLIIELVTLLKLPRLHPKLKRNIKNARDNER